MSDAIGRIKRQLSQRYLAVAGIHGLGVVRSRQVLRVHCERSESPRLRIVLEQLKRDAAPFAVELVTRPRARPSGGSRRRSSR